MSNIINLNKARKKKTRAEQDKAADENRVKFGRTKLDKNATKRDTDKAKRLLDGHEIVDGE